MDQNNREIEIIKQKDNVYVAKLNGEIIWKEENVDLLLAFISAYCFNARTGVYFKFRGED